jgi:hypothetical protein
MPRIDEVTGAFLADVPGVPAAEDANAPPPDGVDFSSETSEGLAAESPEVVVESAVSDGGFADDDDKGSSSPAEAAKESSARSS